MAKNHKGSFLLSDISQRVWLVCAQGWGCCSKVIRGLGPPIHSLCSPLRPWSSAALREQKTLVARPGSSTHHFQPHFTIQNLVTWMHLISGECGKYNPMLCPETKGAGLGAAPPSHPCFFTLSSLYLQILYSLGFFLMHWPFLLSCAYSISSLAHLNSPWLKRLVVYQQFLFPQSDLSPKPQIWVSNCLLHIST